MKKYIYVFMVVVGLGMMGCGHWPWDRGEGPNVLVNPNFDEDPWNTGWIWDTTGSGSGSGDWGVYVARNRWESSPPTLPNCCEIYVSASAMYIPEGSASAEAMIYQMFNEINGAEFKLYMKGNLYVWAEGGSRVEIFFYVNSQWRSIWSTDTDELSDNWAEISGKVDGNVSGIKIYSRCDATSSPGSHVHSNIVRYLWVDNIYVGAK